MQTSSSPAKDTTTKTIRRSFRMKLMIAVFIIAVLVPSLVVWRIYEKGKELQLNGLRRRLMSTAAMLADAIDGDLHATLPQNASAAEHPAFKEIQRMFQIVRDAAPEDFQHIYTLVKTDTAGQGKFIVDLDLADVGKTYKYSRYPEFIRGFDVVTADQNLTEDEYGLWLSGYAPIRNSQGETVAVVGIDMAGSTIKKLRSELQSIALINILSSMILAYGLAILASDWLSKPVRTITNAMKRLADGDLDVHIDIRSGDEFENISNQFNRMVTGLRERDKLKASLTAARDIQENLLPQAAPQVPGLDVSGVSDYCDETGGDYYDYWQLPHQPTRVALTLGDVAGHGVGSALLMAAARMDLRSLVDNHSDDLATMFTTLNQHLCRDVPAGKFITLFFGILDTDSRRLRWISAGHDPALIYRRRSASFETLEADAIPLGIDESAEFAEGKECQMEPGDFLVIGTDGIWEARNTDNELLGVERYRDIILKLQDCSAEDFCQKLLAEVHTFRGAQPQLDDITLVTARFDSLPDEIKH